MQITSIASKYTNIFLDFIMHNHFAQTIFVGAILFGIIYILIEGD